MSFRYNKMVRVRTALVVLALFLFGSTLLAMEMRSTSYRIQMGNLDYTAGTKSSDTYQLRDTAGEFAPGLYTGASNYILKAGFEYVSSIIPFTFTISNDAINFGTLSAQTPVTGTTDLTVTIGAAYGYKVTARQDHQLQNQTYPAVFIPDTVGDSADITTTNQGVWALTTTKGFGYTLANLTGTDAVFTSNYRAFADASLSESPVNVMYKNGVTSESKVRVTYKANILATQESGVYQNTITYIVTGTF